jgi:hypothetical protein
LNINYNNNNNNTAYQQHYPLSLLHLDCLLLLLHPSPTTDVTPSQLRVLCHSKL